MSVIPSINLNIVVAGGTGFAIFTAGCHGEHISLKSPDNTPMFNIDLFNGRGHLLMTAKNVDAQYVRIDGTFKLEGLNKVQISNAADDGVYEVELFIQ